MQRKQTALVISTLAVLGLLGPAYAYTECERGTVKNLFLGTTASDTRTYVSFNDGGSPAFLNEQQLTSGQMARFTALILTAQATGKLVQLRYAEDGLQCPPQGAARSDVIGVWLKN
jgi:hypothetical protein